MDEIEETQTLIEYFEINDGEVFGIQQVDPKSGEVYDQIMMERHIAIDMANDILRMLGDE